MTPGQDITAESLNLDTEVVSFAGWSINVRSGIARRADAEVVLRPQERVLARQFATKPGEALSYEALYFATSKRAHSQPGVNVRSAVKRLRQKLDIDPRGGCLRVIWKYGYRYLPQERAAA